MKKLERRARLCLVLAGLLLAGLGLFLLRFGFSGSRWASSPFNRHRDLHSFPTRRSSDLRRPLGLLPLQPPPL